MSRANDVEAVVLLQAAFIEHLTCYVFTGRTCALGRAARLALELAGNRAVSEAMHGHWQGLAEALEDMMQRRPATGGYPAVAATRPAAAGARPEALSGLGARQPWLVWQRIGGGD